MTHMKTFTALALAILLGASVPVAHAAEMTSLSGARVKVDFNMTNIVVKFNRRESATIAAYGPAAILPAVAVPWVAAALSVGAVYLNNQVNAGRCIAITRPHYGRARVWFYTGGYCR